MELDHEVAHDLVVPVVLLPHLEVLEHFKALLEVHVLEVEEVLEVHDLRKAEEVLEVHDLLKAEEVLEVHYLLKAVEVEGGLVERPLSNSALLLHLVEFLDLCREAAAQEVLSA